MNTIRPAENAARRAVEEWLDQHAPGYPDYSLIPDGEDGWAFYIAEQDTTSYLHHDMKIEWYGTGWPDRYSYDEETGCWSTTPSPQSNVSEPIGYLKPEFPDAIEPRYIKAEERVEDWQKQVFTIPVYAAPQTHLDGSFQSRVQPWLMACFGPEIAADRLERNDRFIEEALELVQACDYPKERALALVDYVYGRDQGEINQEVGGVMVTLAAHCLAHGVDMHEAAETELARIWTKVEQIRAKQKAKPTGSALPVALATEGK